MGQGRWDPIRYADIILQQGGPAPIGSPGGGILPLPGGPMMARAAGPQARAKKKKSAKALKQLLMPALVLNQGDLYFALHTDLEIPDPDDVANLYAAMSNKQFFRDIVPDFLNAWLMPPDYTQTLDGLGYLAGQIQGRVVKRTRHWRFAVVPPVNSADPTLLEISLKVNLNEVITDSTTRQTVYNDLAPTSPPANFLAAIETLASALNLPANAASYPGAAGLLAAVFHITLGGAMFRKLKK